MPSTRWFGAITLIFALTLVLARADQAAVGDTVELAKLPNGKPTRGVLVAQGEFAPCGSKSRANDLHFDSHQYSIAKSSRPCPSLPLYLAPTALEMYLRGNTPLVINNSWIPSGGFTAKPH
jgi:hypothetical protein